jgi:hypothetical protein
MEIMKSVKRLTFAAFVALIVGSSLGLTGLAANASAATRSQARPTSRRMIAS